MNRTQKASVEGVCPVIDDSSSACDLKIWRIIIRKVGIASWRPSREPQENRDEARHPGRKSLSRSYGTPWMRPVFCTTFHSRSSGRRNRWIAVHQLCTSPGTTKRS
jgi:hypothetical protein